MKLKLYLRMVLAVMAAMFTMSGCSSSNEEIINPVEEPLTFQLEVSDVGTGKATVAVKPSKDAATYFCGAMTKAEYDAFASEAEFLTADLKRLQNLATQNKMTLKAYLETHAGRGEGNQSVTTTAASTAHYAYVYGIKTDGTVTSKVFKTEFTSGDAPKAPIVKLKMYPGDSNGANKSVMLSFEVAVTQSPAVAVKYYFNATEAVNEAIAAGETYESLVTNSENEFTADMVAKANTAAGLTGYGFGSPKEPLPADTSCTLIVMATDAKGVVTVEHIEAKTDPAPSGDLTLTINVTNITESTAHIAVTASNETPYFFATIDDASYKELGGTPTTAIPVFLQALWEYAQEQYPDVPLAEILEANVSRGNATYDETKLEPNTLHHEFAVPINMTTGAPTATATMKEFTTTGGGEGPALTVQMLPGDDKEANKDTYMRLGVISTSKDVTSCKYYLNTTAAVDALIKGGKSYDDVITASGTDVPAGQYIDGINGKGLSISFKERIPGTSYTGIIKAGNGKAFTVKYMSASTEGGGVDPSDAYKAWLGTWTVKSASSWVKKAPVSFDVTVTQKAANSTYDLLGWGITQNRTLAKLLATFDSATGKFGINNDQNFGRTSAPDPVGTIRYLSMYDTGKNDWSLVTGTNLFGLIGTMDASKTSATVVGNKGTFEKGGEFTVVGMDLFLITDAGELYTFYADEGFTDDDYPIGPYTMTKKAGASAPVKSMSAVSLNVLSQKNMGAVQMKSGKVVAASDMMSMSSFLKASNMTVNTFVKPDFKAYMKDLNFSNPASAKSGLASIPATLNK